jgi:hypothetical protein
MTSALPVHFRTGLRALGIIGGKPVWPVFGGDDSADAAAQAAAKAAADAAAAKAATDAAAAAAAAKANEPGYPANTAVDDMTPAQQVAYWKFHARKHEDRAKTFGTLTAEQLKELQDKADKHDALEAELGSEADKKAAEAKKTAEADADAKYQPMLAETAFRIAIGDRKTEAEVTGFLEELNLTKFLSADGKVDTVKVLARVEQFAPATGTQGSRPGPSANGQGGQRHQRSPAGAKDVGAGRDLYAEMHPAKK